ncbi:MAG: BrnT family toxin [Mariprofundus sp.]
MISFEWDSIKAVSNKKKHGISFEEAKSVFYDEFAIQFYDSDNTGEEDRFLMLGLSAEHKMLMICHCERDFGNIVRIISARKATKRERTFYEGGRK